MKELEKGEIVAKAYFGTAYPGDDSMRGAFWAEPHVLEAIRGRYGEVRVPILPDVIEFEDKVEIGVVSGAWRDLAVILPPGARRGRVRVRLEYLEPNGDWEGGEEE